MIDKRPIILLDGVAVRPAASDIAPVPYIDHGPPVLMLKPKAYIAYYEIECRHWNGNYEKYAAKESTMSIRPSGRMMFEFRGCQKVLEANDSEWPKRGNENWVA